MHVLTITYKAGRKRYERAFDIADDVANDPGRRAGVISARSFDYGTGGTLVNWRCEPKAQ